MIIAVVIRLNGRDKRGHSSYENRLLFAAIGLLEIFRLMDIDDEVRIYADEEGKEFAERLDIESNIISTIKPTEMNGIMSDELMCMHIASDLSKGLSDQYIVIPDGVIISDLKSLKDKEIIVHDASLFSRMASSDEMVRAVKECAGIAIMNDDDTFFNTVILGGRTSPVWKHVSDLFDSIPSNGVYLSGYAISIIASSFISRQIKNLEYYKAHEDVIFAPRKSRSNIGDDIISGIGRRMRMYHLPQKLALERYLSEKRIY